ncbi:MAG: hypothetical protein QI197_00740 [Candidatus Korarchaeota archaeon]|nr:hypothetical protein [Candidatus Korarchaeota archaeon]
MKVDTVRMIGQPLMDTEGIESLEPIFSAETTTAAVRDEYGRNLWKRDSLEPLQRNFSGIHPAIRSYPKLAPKVRDPVRVWRPVKLYP